MIRYRWLNAGLFAAIAASCGSVYADSIWDRRDPRSAYLFIDNRARRVGDTLTVMVNENTGATNKEQRKMTKDTAASGKFDFKGSTTGASAGKSAAASVSADQSSDRSFNGSAEFDSNRVLTDSVQVTVKDIMPNGNLLIEGIRRRHVSNETRWVRVTGVVRPNDIDIANSVSSQNVADFHIVYEGGGVESRFTNQGWVGRFTNKLWPY